MSKKQEKPCYLFEFVGSTQTENINFSIYASTYAEAIEKSRRDTGKDEATMNRFMLMRATEVPSTDFSEFPPDVRQLLLRVRQAIRKLREEDRDQARD